MTLNHSTAEIRIPYFKVFPTHFHRCDPLFSLFLILERSTSISEFRFKTLLPLAGFPIPYRIVSIGIQT